MPFASACNLLTLTFSAEPPSLLLRAVAVFVESASTVACPATEVIVA